MPSTGGTPLRPSTDDVQLATPATGDQDLQTPPFAADKSSQHTEQLSSTSNVEDGDSPSPTIEHPSHTSPSVVKAVPEQAFTGPSMLGLKENKPLSLVREHFLLLPKTC